MLVREADLDGLEDLLKKEPFLSIDTETTGLYPFKDDRLFCVTISSPTLDLYFDFNDDSASRSSDVSPGCMGGFLSRLFHSPITWYAHNAKFDMHFLNKAFGVYPTNVRDTEVLSRLYDNSKLSYTLEECVKWIGLEKDDRVKAYCDEQGLYEQMQIPGKKKKEKKYYYQKVPFDLMYEYARNDTKVTLQLGLFLDSKLNQKSLTYRIEEKLTGVLYSMEQKGVCLDVPRTQTSLDEQRKIAKDTELLFEDFTGFELIDSEAGLTPVFDYFQIPRTHRTEKGEVSYESDYLESVDSDVARLILKYRESDKLANTFFSSYLYHQREGIIHSDFKQSGTTTGRMSVKAPNLQQVSKEGGVRQLFTPRSSDYCLVMIDYDQMEYRVMLDVAEEMGMIALVLAGLDVHEATSQQMNIGDRKKAKTINFLNIYGGGAAKLASQLGISVDEAKDLRNIYFKSLPKVTKFNRDMIDYAQRWGSVTNWAGRKCNFPDPKFAYRAPNHYIQGGCADVVKRAMCKIHSFLEGKKSNMILSIHDELVFEIHKDELDIVNDIKHIMESAYPHRHLPLTCGVEYSWSNWGDAVGVIKNDEGRIQIQRED